MEWAIVLLMMLIVIAAFAITLSSSNQHCSFKPKGQLYTSVERSFLDMIENATGKEFRIVCRVKLSDIVTVPSSVQKKHANSALNKASAKQIDFILCDKNSMKPVLAIDLVHNAGGEGYKTHKDLFVSQALDSASIPLARIKVKSGYSIEEIRDCIETKLINYRKRQQRLAATRMNPERPNRPTRPLRSSRVAA